MLVQLLSPLTAMMIAWQDRRNFVGDVCAVRARTGLAAQLVATADGKPLIQPSSVPMQHTSGSPVNGRMACSPRRQQGRSPFQGREKMCLSSPLLGRDNPKVVVLLLSLPRPCMVVSMTDPSATPRRSSAGVCRRWKPGLFQQKRKRRIPGDSARRRAQHLLLKIVQKCLNTPWKNFKPFTSLRWNSTLRALIRQQSVCNWRMPCREKRKRN